MIQQTLNPTPNKTCKIIRVNVTCEGPQGIKHRKEYLVGVKTRNNTPQYKTKQSKSFLVSLSRNFRYIPDIARCKTRKSTSVCHLASQAPCNVIASVEKKRSKSTKNRARWSMNHSPPNKLFYSYIFRNLLGRMIFEISLLHICRKLNKI